VTWTPRLPRHRFAFVGLLVGVAALPGACTLDGVIADAGLPGTSFEAEVRDVAERGSYLDAFVDAGGFHYRLFFPADETCRGLLAGPEGLRFTWLGLMGRLSDGEREGARCDAVGVLSLAAWRDRQPRRSREPLPRSPARYQVVYRDADLVQLEGRFPLASQLGFTGTGNLVLVLPNEAACAGFPERGTASMEYRVSGPNPLVLIDGRELCPVLGLAQPLPQVAR
jgi:hypothetical protein